MDVWNGNCSINESSNRRNNDLQNQLSQVTDELNQLKMQLASPQPHELLKDVSSISIHNGSMASTSQSASYILNLEQTSSSTSSSSYKTNGSQYFFEENYDKDKQIELLSNKLIESDKKTNELEKEIERLRNVIKENNG